MTTHTGHPDRLGRMARKCALGAVAALLLLTGCATTSHTAWEYRWITPVRQDFEKEINLAAKDGWEVISAGPDNQGVTMSAILRRAKR